MSSTRLILQNEALTLTTSQEEKNRNIEIQVLEGSALVIAKKRIIIPEKNNCGEV